jgi:16S rRNA (guanine(966)-N(2))-methyltransferase RsmD|tara:strand:+ start:149797 stop:150360 length:564 start_codon:yes stop_codon:yes gene_type:complete
MRITGGTLGGRKLSPPKGKDIRPTSDRLRLAIFNMLESRLDFNDICAADMFCGTGALGIEVLSRGAPYCYFWDQDPRSVSLSKDNLSTLNIESARFQAKIGNSAKLMAYSAASPKLDLVFLDPPYKRGLILPCVEGLINGNWLNKTAWLVVESEKGGLPDLSHITAISEERIKSYGDTDLGLYLYQG